MDNKVDVRQKLKQYLESKGITQAEVASTLDVSKQYVNGLCNGRNVIGKTLAEKLEKYYGLSSSWLLTGKGSMLAGEEESGVMTLPLVPIDAMAGALSGADVSLMDYECERFVVPIFRGAEFLIRVQGDSMMPRYLPGDIVACKRVPLDKLWFQWGKTYIVDTRQGALIKRLEPSSAEGCVSIHSENEAYKPFDLPTDEINGVALVVGLIRVE